MNEKTREHRGGRIRENVMQVVFLIAACISILAVALICIYLFANGLPAIFHMQGRCLFRFGVAGRGDPYRRFQYSRGIPFFGIFLQPGLVIVLCLIFKGNTVFCIWSQLICQRLCTGFPGEGRYH